jgi:HEAT repeat protein
MRFIHGFDHLIVEALLSDDPQTKLQAVHAAGAWELQEAWPEVRRLMKGSRPDKPLLLAAIESAGSIPAHDARALLSRFAEDADEDVASAALESIAVLEGPFTGQLDLDPGLLE